MRVVRFLAVVWLLVIVEAMLEESVFGAVWMPAGSEASLDASDQEVRSGEPIAPTEEARAYLQVALLQLAERGDQEAVLCAASVPLHEGVQHKVVLRFHHLLGGAFTRDAEAFLARDRSRSLAPGAKRAMRYGALPHGFRSAQVRLFFDVEHVGTSGDHHLLRQRECRLVGSDGFLTLARDDSQLIDTEGLACRDGSPCFLFEESMGIAAMLRVSSEPVADGEVVLRSFWREASAQMPVASEPTHVPAGFVVRDARADAVRASLVWQDRALADRLRREQGEWLQQSGNGDGWLSLLSARWVSEVERTFFFYPGTFDVGYGGTLVRRAAGVQQDSADAARIRSWAPEIGIRAWVLPALILLVALALAFYVPAREVPRRSVGRGAILVLWLAFVLEIGGVSGVLFAGVFLMMLIDRAAGRATGIWLRTLAGLGLGACGIWCAQWFGAGPVAPAFVLFASMGRILCWLVLAHWVVADATLRARVWLVAAVVAIMMTNSVGALFCFGFGEDVVMQAHAAGLAVTSVLVLVAIGSGRKRLGGGERESIDGGLLASAPTPAT